MFMFMYTYFVQFLRIAAAPQGRRLSLSARCGGPRPTRYSAEVRRTRRQC